MRLENDRINEIRAAQIWILIYLCVEHVFYRRMKKKTSADIGMEANTIKHTRQRENVRIFE